MDNWGQGTFTLYVSRLYRRAIGVSDAECVLVDSYPVFPPKYWSTGFLHYIFETVERDICKEW